MRLDKLTEKSREALLEAQHLAEQYTHPAVEPEHLLLTLLDQEGGVVPSVVRKIGGDPTLLRSSVEAALNKLPRATGSSVQVGLSRDLNAILSEAESIAGAMKDDFTSTEHMLMAMAQPKGGRARADQGVHLVDEQDNLPLGVLHLFQHGLQPLFELAAVLGPGDQRAQIKRHQPLVLQPQRHVAVDDALGQPLDDGSLAHTRLADEHRVCLLYTSPSPRD